MMLVKYGVAVDVYLPAITRGAQDFLLSPILATADCKVSIDGGALATITAIPTNSPSGSSQIKVALTSAEVTGKIITVQLIDSATKAWEDQEIMLQTYGHASASIPFDLSQVTPQVNSVSIGGVAPASATIGTVTNLTNAPADMALETKQNTMISALTTIDTALDDVAIQINGLTAMPGDIVTLQEGIDEMIDGVTVQAIKADALVSIDSELAPRFTDINNALTTIDQVLDRFSFTEDDETIVVPSVTVNVPTNPYTRYLVDTTDKGVGQLVIGVTINDDTSVLKLIANYTLDVTRNPDGTHEVSIADVEIIYIEGLWGSIDFQMAGEFVSLIYNAPVANFDITSSGGGTLTLSFVDSQTKGMDTDVLTASALKDDAVAEIQLGLATEASVDILIAGVTVEVIGVNALASIDAALSLVHGPGSWDALASGSVTVGAIEVSALTSIDDALSVTHGPGSWDALASGNVTVGAITASACQSIDSVIAPRFTDVLHIKKAILPMTDDGTVKYVTKTGNNSNSGNGWADGEAYATIVYALTQMPNGGILYLGPGTWDEDIVLPNYTQLIGVADGVALGNKDEDVTPRIRGLAAASTGYTIEMGIGCEVRNIYYSKQDNTASVTAAILLRSKCKLISCHTTDGPFPTLPQLISHIRLEGSEHLIEDCDISASDSTDYNPAIIQGGLYKSVIRKNIFNCNQDYIIGFGTSLDGGSKALIEDNTAIALFPGKFFVNCNGHSFSIINNRVKGLGEVCSYTMGDNSKGYAFVIAGNIFQEQTALSADLPTVDDTEEIKAIVTGGFKDALVLHVDETVGLDTYNGLDWNTPKKTIAAAIALTEAGRGDYIFLKPKSSFAYVGNFTLKSGSKLIGVIVDGEFAEIHGTGATPAIILDEGAEIKNLRIGDTGGNNGGSLITAAPGSKITNCNTGNVTSTVAELVKIEGEGVEIIGNIFSGSGNAVNGINHDGDNSWIKDNVFSQLTGSHIVLTAYLASIEYNNFMDVASGFYAVENGGTTGEGLNWLAGVTNNNYSGDGEFADPELIATGHKNSFQNNEQWATDVQADILIEGVTVGAIKVNALISIDNYLSTIHGPGSWDALATGNVTVGAITSDALNSIDNVLGNPASGDSVDVGFNLYESMKDVLAKASGDKLKDGDTYRYKDKAGAELFNMTISGNTVTSARA